MYKRFLLILSLLFALELPCASAKLEVPHLPDPPPVSLEKVDTSLQLGVEFLLKNQNPDGSWGRYTNSLSDPVLCPAPCGPLAFRIGTTSLDIMALAAVAPQDPRVKQALNRASEWLLKELPRLRRPSTGVLYNVWGHGYALQALSALAHLHQDEPERVARYKAAAETQLQKLGTYSNLKGGWGYYEFNDITVRPSCFSMSFTTAAILVAMKDAEVCFGLKDDKVSGKAIALLERLRTGEGTYMYGDYMKRNSEARPYNRHMGSLGRTIACNFTLARYGIPYATSQIMEDRLDWMWARNGWLLLAKKWPIPHESYAKNAGYFVFFGYYYAGRTLDKIPPARQMRHASLLASILLPQQEPSGCWWDFPIMDYHRQYGTGFALLALSQARKILSGTHSSAEKNEQACQAKSCSPYAPL